MAFWECSGCLDWASNGFSKIRRNPVFLLNIGGDIVGEFYVKSKLILPGKAYEFNVILTPNYPVFAGFF